MTLLFPQRFGSKTIPLNLRVNLKNYLLAKAEYLADPTEENTNKLAENYKAYLEHTAQRAMDAGEDSYTTELERAYIKMQSVLLEKGINKPRELKVTEFYGLVDRYEEIAKKQKEAIDKIKSRRK